MLRHHYPFIPFGRLVMKRHHYPLIPCAPCSGKSRFDLVHVSAVYFNCKYFTSLYFVYARAIRMPPRDFASRQNPWGGGATIGSLALTFYLSVVDWFFLSLLFLMLLCTVYLEKACQVRVEKSMF